MTIPARTCVGCRAKKPSKDMTRVTKLGEDFVFGGPSNGRGAWLCSDSCRNLAVARGTLGRVIRGRPKLS